MENYFEHGYALLIGIRYGHWSRPLNGTIKDVNSLTAHFTDKSKAAYKKENVISVLEENATAKGILEGFDELIAKVDEDSEATVIVYYSGHGETNGTDYFLVPYDFDLKNWRENTTYEKDNVVLSSQFAEKIDRINAKKSLVILDCCHSENIPVLKDLTQQPSFLTGFIDKMDAILEPSITRNISSHLKKGGGNVILTSCEAGEKSLDLGSNGLFTKVFLECLSGEKNIEQDGWVRLIDMIRYIPSEVSKRAKEHLINGEPHNQNPVFKRIENLGAEDFIIGAYSFTKAIGGIPKVENKKNDRAEKQIFKMVEAGVWVNGLKETKISVSPTVFFDNRFGKAFPGLRGLKWFHNSEKALYRLSLLLKFPLEFGEYNDQADPRPIWWFRGFNNNSIRTFTTLSKTKCLINTWEVEIERIAVFESNHYFRHFIYVETKPEPQVGVRQTSEEEIESMTNSFGYAFEEYGIIEGVNVTREEFDDGAAEIDGVIVDADGKAELRRRFLTKFNFIIAAKFSPYNSRECDKTSLPIYNKLLKDESKIEDLIQIFENLPRIS